MSGNVWTRKLIRAALYIAAIILINAVGITLFFRIDLTQNRLYSLSDISRQVVATLSEPLTINVFFTQNLPAPHNNTERYLRDLLEEYALHGNRKFNYIFYDVSPEGESINPAAAENRKLASDYGIHPVQIQIVENDEIKFKNAYMGLAIIHGDVIERIPALTSTSGLEYKLTTTIQKLNHKISALLALEDKIRITLFLSGTLKTIAPFMGLDDMPRLPETVKSVVARLNKKNYDKLAYDFVNPATAAQQKEVGREYNLRALEWPDILEANIPAGSGVIGLLMQYAGNTVQLPLLNAVQIPIIGTRYELLDAAQMEEMITDNLESMIQINEDIGMIASHGVLGAQAGPRGQADGITNFTGMVSKSYNIKRVDLTKENMPEGLQSMVIARPTERFSDHALYQIDQALMRGTNLMLVLDSLKEEMPSRQAMAMRQGPTYKALDTGLDALLSHYGVSIGRSYVMDENCYKQQVPRSMGGGERAIYFAPMIQNRHINHDLPFMENIRGLIVVKASPLTTEEKRLEAQGVTARVLFSSSDRSWEMKDNINLNPVMLAPPGPDTDTRSYPLAYLLEGSFASYFDGKPIPTRTVDAGTEAKENTSAGRDLSMIHGSGAFIARGKPGRIVVLAASEMIKDNVLDPDDNTPNGVFILNVIDALNGREAIAVMRAKQQVFNPLDDTTAVTKAAIKWLNIAGLPVLVICFGLVVWMRRAARRKSIQAMFSTTSAASSAY